MIAPGSQEAFERALTDAAGWGDRLGARLADAVPDAVLTEIRDGGRYSPGTPVRTGGAREAWTREDEPAASVLRNPLPRVRILEEGSSQQAPQGFVRIVVAAAPLLAAEVGTRVIAESA